MGEAISWLLIYRTEDYKRLKESIDALSKKLDKKKDTIAPLDKQKQHGKKVANMDEQLKTKNRNMQIVKMKSMVFVMFSLFAVFGLLNNLFDGSAVAKLPFVPFPLIRGLTHRNLPGNDDTDCSMMFVYLLCSFSIRASVTRYFGFSPKGNQMQSFFTPPDSTAYGKSR